MLIIASLAAFLFYDDVFNRKVEDHENYYARVIEVKGEVKLKYKGHLHWVAVKKEKLVNIGDQIYTGEESSITIQTIKGLIKISIKENTLITIHKSLLGIDRGLIDLVLRQNQQIQLELNDSKFDVKSPTESSLEIGQESIKVNKGNVEVSNKIGLINLATGQTMKVEENGSIKLDGLKKILIEQRFLSEKVCTNERLGINWKSTVTADQYKIAIYHSATAQKPTQEFTQNKSIYYPDISRFANRFFISIYGIQKGKLVSSIERKEIIIINTKRIPVAVGTKSVFIKGESISFNKVTTNGLESDQDLIPYLKKGSKVINLAAINYDTSDIEKGSYQSKLCYESPLCSRRCVAGKTIKIKDLGLPRLIYPLMNEVVTTALERTPVTFKWLNMKQAKYDDLRIILIDKETNDVSEIPISTSAGKNQKQLQSMRKSSYSWQIVGSISSMDFETKEAHFVLSDQNIFKNLSENYISTKRKKLHYDFSWGLKKKDTSIALYHEIKINNKSFESKLNTSDREEKSYSKTFPISEKFEWRLIGKKKNKIVSTSPWKKVLAPTCKSPALLDPPIVTYIEADGEVADNPIFRWKPVSGARSYKIIIRSKTNSQKSYEYESKTEVFEWPKPRVGEHSWRIIPIDTNGVDCYRSATGVYKKN